MGNGALRGEEWENDLPEKNQLSYWKWPFIDELVIENGDFP